MPLAKQARMYWRFFSGLKGFLKEPVTLARSHETIKERLGNRERNLITSVKMAIFDNATSPYARLLRNAGCEYEDFRKMILSDGIQDTLRYLYCKGVYVTLDEFKGRQEIRRGSASFAVSESDFDAPLKSEVIVLRSGGTRSAGTRTAYDFGFLSNYSIHRVMELEIAGAFESKVAGLWMPILPGGGPRTLLTFAKSGITPARWFTQTGKRGSGSHLRDRVATRYIVYAGRLLGKKWPLPEYVTIDQARHVAGWIADSIGENGSCFLTTYPSSAVRVCQAAGRSGMDIAGARFAGGGEPFTEAKKAEIESAGATYRPSYSSVETGIMGLSCVNESAAGEVHLLTDSFALIQHNREVKHAGISVDAFLFTTLLPLAPKVMFNTETGDYGSVETRKCGCQLDDLGLGTHLSGVRGFDKMTAEGMTLIGTDLVRVIEDVLPARFGGSSTDYQIVEEEDEMGRTRMSIIVSPTLGDIDELEVVQTVLAALPKGGITPHVWSFAETFRVKRARPAATPSGKLMSLIIMRRERQ